MQGPKKIHIWAGMWKSEVIEPEQFPYTLNGEGYLDFLEISFQIIMDHILEEEIKAMWY